MDGSAAPPPGSSAKLRAARLARRDHPRRVTYVARLEPRAAGAIEGSAADSWRTVEALVPAVVLTRSRTTETAVTVLADGARVVRKRWTWPRRRDRLKGALRTTFAARSPARREFEALARLASLPGGGFAPNPLGWLEHRERGVLQACTLLLDEVPQAVDLARWLAAERGAERREALLARLAERLRTMHDAGLADFEMHPRNVLVAADGRVLKVDCAKQRHRTGAASRTDRVRDLAALDVGLVRLAAAERDGFLRAYLGAAATAAGLDSLDAAVTAERRRIDARESRRLPR